MKKILPFIMCGGAGLRLWPESRRALPKQFLPLIEGRSTFQRLAEQIRNYAFFEPKLRILTHYDYRFLIEEQLEQIGVAGEVILETISRDSATTLGLATEIAMQEDPSHILALFPSDHFIPDLEGWFKLFQEAYPCAHTGGIVTFGICPKQSFSPFLPKCISDFGYIRARVESPLSYGIAVTEDEGKAALRKRENGERVRELQEGSVPWGSEFGLPEEERGNALYERKQKKIPLKLAKVENFIEKPSSDKAEEYISQGYLWNSGALLFRADVMQGELLQFVPAVVTAVSKALEKGHKERDYYVLDESSLAQAPPASLDKAILQRTDKVFVLPTALAWSDLGTWASMRELCPSDENGNAISGRGVVMESKNTYIRSPNHLTAVLGVEGLSVITTDDAVLVVHNSHLPNLKELVGHLQADKWVEGTTRPRAYRPWGHYENVDKGKRHRVKHLVIKPQAQLSLQRHFHRSEHWVIVQGIAEVVLDGEQYLIHENESIHLPLGVVHQVRNPGKINLEMIEVQIGSYLEEDDIVRFQDIYQRV